jgi:Protein of unknown function (DUF2961)
MISDTGLSAAAGGFLEQLPRLSSAATERVSSWDRSGGNRDWTDVPPGTSVTLLDVDGPGLIRHLYWAVIRPSPNQYRQVVLRMYWDGHAEPCVEAPIGDLFGIAFSTPVHLHSLAMVVNPGNANAGSYPYTCGLNCYFPMPFAHGARIDITNESDRPFGERGGFWYHFEYERHANRSAIPETRFHAQYRQATPTPVSADKPKNVQLWDGKNLSDADNYHILEASGQGHLVGLHLQIDNLGGGWYGEGDDMIFVDQPAGDWPPRYHGTGTEEIFGGGACPSTPYSGPYTGFHLIEAPNWSRRTAMYRWYLNDPVRFQESLRFSIEHGHANNFENDYCSVAYWYQTEPHAAFPALPRAAERVPRRWPR